tara:strand:+ start:1230 stop:1445 length:216 start_codon:yes stop_codon:yes gene_type:complete
MSWFCDTEEAKEHKKNCKKNPWNCGKCVWIDESAIAMGRYGKVVKKERDLGEPHPLTDLIIEKFNGRIIDE